MHSVNKKLIRRWDGERELSLRRHCTRTRKYNRHLRKFGHRSCLQRTFTKFSEITQCNAHYAVQGHSRSPIWVPIESSYTTSYYWLILTCFLSCTVSKLWLIIGQIFAIARTECLTLTFSLGWFPANIAISDISLKTRFCGLYFRCRKYWCVYKKGPEKRRSGAFRSHSNPGSNRVICAHLDFDEKII